MKSRTRTSQTVSAIALAVVLVAFSATTTMQQAWALTDIVNDQWFSFGKKYWGDKNGGTNGYTGTLGQAFYCRNNDGTVKAGCSGGLIDSRTNFVRHALKLNPSSSLAYQTSLQGCDPWAQCDTSLGAAVHNTNFPRSPVAPSGNSYYLFQQFAWFTNSFYSESKPGSSTADVTANLLTNLWFKDKLSTTDTVVVIDFGWASLKNNNGVWQRQSIAPGNGWDIAWYENVNGQCRYHKSIMLDNNSAANTWRDTGAINISSYIANVFSTSYTLRGSNPNGTCSSTIAGSSNYAANYDLVDIETGVEMYPNNGASSSKYGTIVAAYSRSGFYYA